MSAPGVLKGFGYKFSGLGAFVWGFWIVYGSACSKDSTRAKILQGQKLHVRKESTNGPKNELKQAKKKKKKT